MNPSNHNETSTPLIPNPVVNFMEVTPVYRFFMTLVLRFSCIYKLGKVIWYVVDLRTEVRFAQCPANTNLVVSKSPLEPVTPT